MLLPQRLILIFVDVAESIRIQRIINRGDCDLATLNELESHSTEIQVITSLRSSAEFIADNSGTLESAVDGIQYWLHANKVVTR